MNRTTPLAALLASLLLVFSPAGRADDVERYALPRPEGDRIFALYRPPGLEFRRSGSRVRLPPAPAIVLVFHGSGGKAHRIRRFTGRAFERLADRHGFVVVYPEGFEGNWNGCRARAPFSARTANIDDLGFVRDVIREVRRRLGVGEGPLFAFGYSGGGHLVFRILLEAPELLSAAAVVGANLPVDDELDCTPSERPLPSLLLVNGTADPINPYGGGEVALPPALGGAVLGTVRSSLETAAWFAARAGHRAPPVVERSAAVERHFWSGPGTAEVRHVAVEGGGHTIPQPGVAFPEVAGTHREDLDVPSEVWGFFAGVEACGR